MGQQRNIFLAVTQRRKFERDHVEAVKEILAESAFPHGLLQLDIGRRHNPDVHLDLLGSTHMHKAAVLEHAQNLRLHVHPHGANLVEEERSSIRHLEQALLRRDRRCESTALMPKQRGLEQIRRHRSRIHGNEGFIAPWRVRMDCLRDQLFAGSALALDQHRRPARSHLRYQIEQTQHRLALPHDIFKGHALLQGSFEVHHLLFGAVFTDCHANIRQQLLVVPGLLDKV